MPSHMSASVIQFNDPIKEGGSCNVCIASYSPDPVTVLEIGTYSPSPMSIRLCAMHLKVLREAVLEEHRKRVIVPYASQRRREGGLPEGEQS